VKESATRVHAETGERLDSQCEVLEAGLLGGRRSLLGLLLLVPAGLVWALAMVWPTVRLIVASLAQGDIITGAGSAYDSVFFPGYDGWVLRALSLWLLPLVVFVAVGLVVGWAGSRSGRRVRLVARCLLALPVVCFAPAVAVGAWLSSSAHAGAARPRPADIRLLVLVGAFGLVCSVGATVYLAAFHATRPYRTVVAVTGFAVLAFLALGVQEVNFPYVAQRMGVFVRVPASRASIEMGAGNFGVAAAHLVVMFGIAAVLGLAAVAVLIGTRTRLVADAGSGAVWRPPLRAGKAEGVLLAVVAVVLAATGYTLWPWLRSLFADGTPQGYHAGHVLTGSWLAPLPSVVACLVTALPAAFCIGALRPLGRRTELLLLPFAPWLFVGVAQVAVVHLVADSQGPLKGVQGLEALTQPVWLSVPALVFFSLLFRGQHAVHQAAVARGVPPGRALVEAYLRPVWPAVVLVALGMWVVEASDFAWPAFALSYSAEQAAATNVYARALGLVGREPAPSAGIVTPVAVVVLVMLVAVAAQSYLDRLTIRSRSCDAAVQPSTVYSDRRVPAQRTAQDRPPVAVATAPCPRGYRVILACAGLGLALALTAITASCAASGTGPESPSLPGVPGAPGVAPSRDSIIRGR
jgi:hypothetical protein